MVDIVTWPNEVLKTPTQKFDFETQDAIGTSKVLAAALLSSGGVGLAANQIGIPIQALAFVAEQVVVMFNPIIVDYSEDSSYLVEGCLSSPNLFVSIKRPNEIRVRYALPSGEVVTSKFGGITARIIQHEIDHLNGVHFTQRATRFHLEKAKKVQKNTNMTPMEMVQKFAGY